MLNGAIRVLGCFAALAVLASVQPADALTMQQCSEKYKSAQKAGAVEGMNWAQFRAAECGADASMAIKKTKSPHAAATGPSMEECSARYKDAKAAGTLGDMTWNAFRSAGCVAKTAAAKKPAQKNEAAQRPTTAPAQKHETAKAAEPVKVSEQECSSRYQAAKAAGTLNGMTWNAFRSAGCPTVTARRTGGMVPTAAGMFPVTVAKKYSHLPAGHARMLTCRDQYEANKAAGIAELTWSEEGGGYYSECNKRLSEH